MKDYSKSNYEKLLQIIPDLERHLMLGSASGKSKSPPFMDLNLDFLSDEGNGKYRVALSHNYEMNGDLVPDPDMEIRIDVTTKVADAVSYQNILLYQRVDESQMADREKSAKLQAELNEFLNSWLTNAIDQDHRIKLPEIDQRELRRLDELKSTRFKNGENEKSIDR